MGRVDGTYVICVTTNCLAETSATVQNDKSLRGEFLFIIQRKSRNENEKIYLGEVEIML